MRVHRWWHIVLLGAFGCAGGMHDARVAELLTITPDGRTLSVAVDSCNASPVVEIVEPGVDRVVLAATSERNAGGDCADVVSVVLDEPLGDRRLVDRVSGDDVPAADLIVTDDPAV